MLKFEDTRFFIMLILGTVVAKVREDFVNFFLRSARPKESEQKKTKTCESLSHAKGFMNPALG